MNDHPIENLMLTAMESIRSMIDVNTIIGEPMVISENTSIIPISKVGFGLASGGSEFKNETPQNYLKKKEEEEQIQYKLPFGGGAGVGASITPIAFIVVQNDVVKLLPIEHQNTFDKLLDYTPDVIQKVQSFFESRKNYQE